jgi:hypothetical protein
MRARGVGPCVPERAEPGLAIGDRGEGVQKIPRRAGQAVEAYSSRPQLFPCAPVQPMPSRPSTRLSLHWCLTRRSFHAWRRMAPRLPPRKSLSGAAI